MGVNDVQTLLVPSPLIRRCTAGDAEVLRSLRLAMLAESPTSFNVDTSAIVGETPTYWQNWAEAAAQAKSRVVFFVYVADQPVAMIAAHLEGTSVHTGALWVSPHHRGRHVANALLDHVETWAHDVRAVSIELSVAEWNTTAIHLYTARHYTPTAQRIPTRFGHDELVMTKSVGF